MTLIKECHCPWVFIEFCGFPSNESRLSSIVQATCLKEEKQNLKLQDTRVEIGLIWNTASPTTCKEEKLNQQFIRSPNLKVDLSNRFIFGISVVFESPYCALSAYHWKIFVN
ncbi:hypothetical protein Avbf_17800 [Armadillidium vulgare]|nr:hypothetical protein Avbf_17800 [Armadillidium vulgare]